MGWLQTLAGIGGAIAAPFTGGATLPLTFGSFMKQAAPGLIGSVASGLAGGAQKGREGQNNNAIQQALFAQQENQNKYRAGVENAGIDLERRKFAQGSQSDAYKKAIQSALGMNLQDAHVNRPKGVPNISYSGGLRPSALGAEGRAASSELNKQAMLKLMNGEKFDELPQYQGTAAPTYKGPGAFENIMGTVGLGANSLNTAMGAAEDRSAMQKYIDAITELMKQQPASRLPGEQLPMPGQ